MKKEKQKRKRKEQSIFCPALSYIWLLLHFRRTLAFSFVLVDGIRYVLLIPDFVPEEILFAYLKRFLAEDLAPDGTESLSLLMPVFHRCLIEDPATDFVIGEFINQAESDTPMAKAHWVLIYIHFQICSKAYETNEFL